MKAFEADIAAIAQMQEMSRALAPLCEALDDSPCCRARRPFREALMFYRSVKGAAKAMDPPLDTDLYKVSIELRKASRDLTRLGNPPGATPFFLRLL